MTRGDPRVLNNIDSRKKVLERFNFLRTLLGVWRLASLTPPPDQGEGRVGVVWLLRSAIRHEPGRVLLNRTLPDAANAVHSDYPRLTSPWSGGGIR